MSVVGIVNNNAVISNPYQIGRRSDKGKEGGFHGIMNVAQTAQEETVNDSSRADAENDMEGKICFLNGITAHAMEARLTSGIIGFGALEDGTVYSASYDKDSTIGNPIVNIRLESKNGGAKTYKICVNQVDVSNATQLEMLALCSHADKQEMSGSSKEAHSYSTLLYYAHNSANGDREARNAEEFISLQRNWSAMITDAQLVKLEREEKIDASNGKRLQSMFEAIEKYKADSDKANVGGMQLFEQALKDKRADNGVPYNYLAKDGIIEYNGVIFVCDEKHKAIHLGDTSNPKNCLNIPLSGGGSLIVNRDNLGDLAKAIGMFTPEDANLIMRAIAQDAKVQQMKNQIDEETSGVDLADD